MEPTLNPTSDQAERNIARAREALRAQREQAEPPESTMGRRTLAATLRAERAATAAANMARPRWTAVVHILNGRRWISTTVTVEATEAGTAARRAIEEGIAKALKPRTRIVGVRLNLTRVKGGA